MAKKDAFLAGEVTMEFPYEPATFRDEQATGTMFHRFQA
jgi:hypothetical protein